MKNVKRAALLIALMLFFLPSNDAATRNKPSKGKNSVTSTARAMMNTAEPYAEKWEAVKAFDEKGKPRSTLEVVEEILVLAKKDHNAPQIVKAHIYRIKQIMVIGEKEHPEILRMLEKETDAASYPEKQILQSLLAEAYWNYFSANRYTFYKRSETTSVKEDDISTWSLGKIMSRIITLYNESIAPADTLKKIELGFIDALLVKGSAPRIYRPTLYDFLAHRAVDFFMIDESQLSKPVYEFQVDAAGYFAPAENFSKMIISSRDSSSVIYNAMMVLQQLTVFHLGDVSTDPSALIDVELKRLIFVRSKSIVPDKDALYIKALQDLEKRFPSCPATGLVSYEIAQWYRAKGFEWKEGDPGDHKWSIKKSKDIATEVVQKFPDSEAAYLCKPLTIMDKNLIVVAEQVNVPDKAIRALVRYKNISGVHLRVIKLSDDMQEYLSSSSDSSEIKADKLAKKEAIHEWTVGLPDDGDLREHSTELRIPPLKQGAYAILAGTDKLFSCKQNAVAFMAVRVSNLSFVHRMSRTEGAVFYVYNRDTGEPLEGVKATIYERKYDYSKSKYVTNVVGKKTTDKNGFMRVPLDFKDRYYYSTMSIALRKDKDYLKSDFYNYTYTKESKNKYVSYFFTDRSIYRPGQMIYFKGILLQLDGENCYKIMPDQDTTVEFIDHNYQKIADVQLRSNEFGAVSGTFTAPVGTITGQMTIRNNTGSAYIRVEEYKRPKFEAVFEPVKGKYRLNDTIKAKGYARSYAGAPLSDATVKFSVVRKVWFLYRYWGWYYWHFQGAETVIKKGEIKTDAKGEYIVDFEALPDPRIPRAEQPSFYYYVNVDVTDINGETHSASTNIRAGFTSLIVDAINLPGSVDASRNLAFELSTTNFSGEFMPAAGTVTISRLREPERLLRNRLWDKPDRHIMTKEEYIKNFPNDIFMDEDDMRMRGIDRKVYSASFDTAKDKKIIPGAIANWPDGDYTLAIETVDSYGEKIHVERNFSVYMPKDDSFSRKTYLYLTPLQSTVEPGTDASFMVGSAAAHSYVLLDIIRRGEKIEKKIIKLDRSKKILSIPVTEEDRGNISYRYALIKNNRCIIGYGTIYVPWTNKELKAEFATFRNKLNPGEKDEWRIKIFGPKGERAAAEMVASMYDASLDSFYPHAWYFNVNQYFYNYEYWNTNTTFSTDQSRLAYIDWYPYYTSYDRTFDRLNLFGIYFYSRGRNYRYSKGSGKMDMYMAEGESAGDREEDTVSEKKEKAKDESASKKVAPAPEKPDQDDKASDQRSGLTGGKTNTGEAAAVQIRKNLNETAFFYPHLKTDEKGEVIVTFTAPEALTRWRILAFAHTRDLKSTVFTNELVTQKELMVMPNMPRFLREGDSIFLSTKISNLTDKKLAGQAELLLFDSVTMKPLDRDLGNERNKTDFTVSEKGNTVVNWKLSIPESLEAVTWRVVARAGSFSDGEESTLPVLSNRMLVTESMPLPVRSNETKKFTFNKLINSKSSTTLTHFRLTLEFTSNPVWYAVQALPYLMEYPHECSEQVFSRFYSNSLASHIVNSSPKIKTIFDQWKTSDALLSNLQKNEELKSVMLQETPWLLNGKNEEQNKKRVALLFDLNRMAHELGNAFSKLKQMQGYNGGWPWFPGLPESWYITQHILAGLAKLNALGVKEASKDKLSGMTTKAVAFIDAEMKRDYDYLLQYKINLKQRNIGYIHYHYLYTRSFFKDIPVPDKCKEAFNYWKGQAVKYWPQEGPYGKGLAAIALFRFGENKAAKEVMESLKETAIYHDEMGMFWKENVGGYSWFQAPIETQALLVEAFEEVAHDRKAVDDMRTWLVKMKQVQHWSTTKATTDACYALLLGGTDWLKNDQLAEVLLNDNKVDPVSMGAKIEAGTGYYKVSWNKNDIVPDMGKVTVVNRNNNPAWGALYWQYFEQLDKITAHETPLKLEKKLFLVKSTDKGDVLEPVAGGTKLKPGDKLKVRIILRSDRDMDYVHMKDMRASGVEPVNVLSRHKFQDGLWYYESTKDIATHFFIERLPKGTFVFEYPLVANLKGNFSAGITTIQCMYAPEFTSHSEGTRISVE